MKNIPVGSFIIRLPRRKFEKHCKEVIKKKQKWFIIGFRPHEFEAMITGLAKGIR